MKSNKKAGFSLIELSVVLVILALLTGGILGGRHLIEAARVNKTLREVNEYKALFLQFDDRFGSLPGDLANATSYWPDCVDNTSNNRCNGNGDGFVGGFVTWYTNEPMRAMEHLSRAEMVSGQYNASAMTIHSAYLSVVSSSISMDSLPKSAFSDSAAYMISRVTSGHSLAAHLTGKDFVVLGALVPNGGGTNQGNFERLFTPEEAFLIDQKTDDGSSMTGSTMSSIQWPTSPPLCSSGAGVYQLNVTEPACVLFFQF